MGRKTAQKKAPAPVTPTAAPREIDTTPSAASLVAVAVFLLVVLCGGWFVFDRLSQESQSIGLERAEQTTVAAVPPYPVWHTDDNGAQTGEFDREQFSAFFEACGLPPLKNELPMIERGQCEQFYDDLKAMGRLRGSEQYGQVGRYFHFWEILDEARACYEMARDKAPDNYEWHHYLAYIAFPEGREAEAEAGYKKAISLIPEGGSYAGSHMQLARLYMMLGGRNEEARAMYLKATEIESENPHPYAELSNLALLDGDLEEAKRLALEAISRDDNDKRAHSLLTSIYGQQGDEERAAYHQDRAEGGANYSDPVTDHLIMDLRRKTNALAFHQQLADVYYQRAQWGELIEKQREIVARDPRMEMKLRLAVALSRADKHEEARKVAREIIDSHRHDPLVHYQLGEVEKRAGDLDAALEKTEDALARDPQMLQALRMKAEILGTMKRYAEGEKAVDQALSLDPTDYALHMLKGQFVYMRAFQEFMKAYDAEAAAGKVLPESTATFKETLARYYLARAHLDEARRLPKGASSDRVVTLGGELRRNVDEVEIILRARNVPFPEVPKGNE